MLNKNKHGAKEAMSCCCPNLGSSPHPALCSPLLHVLTLPSLAMQTNCTSSILSGICHLSLSPERIFQLTQHLMPELAPMLVVPSRDAV